MENIKIFNNELFSLYDQKPPISKAKMASITRSAMKAIKFYKHVVQSVEKFILKCKTEYKIPGLYVIDSIVRQSRHQFGADKDLFAPRFARNIEITFANLFSCPVEDKSKIIRVLNLWQKNSVFAPEVIGPLFDLANPDHPIHVQINNQQANQDNSSNFGNGMNLSHDSPLKDDLAANANATELAAGASSSQHQLDTNTIRQLQQFQQMLMRQTNSDPQSQSAKDTVKFNKKLLDYDYGSDEEDDKNKSPKLVNIPDPNNIAQILSDPNVLKQLQNLQKLKQHEMEEKQSKLSEMRKQEEKFEKHLATVLKKLPFASECDLSRTNLTAELHQSGSNVMYQSSISGYNTMLQVQPGQSSKDGKDIDGDFVLDDGKVEVINLDANDSRSPSRDRSRRRRSRSRSRDRRGERGRRRSRSLSRSPRRRRSSRDRKDREQERERRKRGLPDIKKDHLSVCSTTLWVGHLSKLVQQEELSDTFGKYGDIISIDMIPPRGCAFIVMNRRQDAFKSMQSLKGFKMQGRAITISWAAGKGVKSKEWKDYWDIDLGVSYIPYDKISPATNFESLEEGGMLDEDTMPQWLIDLNAAKQFKIDGLQSAMQPTLFNLDISQPPPTGVVNPLLATFPSLRLMGLSTFGLPPPNMNAPPPSLSAVQTNALTSSFGLLGSAPPLMPPPPIINQIGASVLPLLTSTMNDDKMDIETDEEHHNKPGDGIFFNHPPPKLDGSSMYGGLKLNDQLNSSDRMQDKKPRSRDDSRERTERRGGRDRERNDYTKDRERDNSWERNRNRSNRWNNNNQRGNSRDRDNSYSGVRERREKSYDRMRDGGGRNNRELRRDDDTGRPFTNQVLGFRDNSRRLADSGIMFDDSRAPMSRQGDFKRGDDRRGPFPGSRFPGPPGVRGPGPGSRGAANFGPRGGPMFGRGGRSQGFRFTNERPNFGGNGNYGSDDRDRSYGMNRDQNRQQPFNKNRGEDDVFGDFESSHEKKSRWENEDDKNNSNTLNSDNDSGRQEKVTDIFEDMPAEKSVNRPVYEDKGPPGYEDHMDMEYDANSDPVTSMPAASPPPPPIIDCTLESQADSKAAQTNDAQFGNTTPLFDEPQESTASIPVEQKDCDDNQVNDE